MNFRIPRGRVVGFLGPNGAGKTTTIRMITGFLAPSGGRVEVDGLDVASQPREVRRRIGYMPESTPLYTEMRVGEYLHFRARLFGLPRAGRRGAVEAAAGRAPVRDVIRRPIGHLSKGYRQRVGLAAARSTSRRPSSCTCPPAIMMTSSQTSSASVRMCVDRRMV